MVIYGFFLLRNLQILLIISFFPVYLSSFDLVSCDTIMSISCLLTWNVHQSCFCLFLFHIHILDPDPPRILWKSIFVSIFVTSYYCEHLYKKKTTQRFPNSQQSKENIVIFKMKIKLFCGSIPDEKGVYIIHMYFDLIYFIQQNSQKCVFFLE